MDGRDDLVPEREPPGRDDLVPSREPGRRRRRERERTVSEEPPPAPADDAAAHRTVVTEEAVVEEPPLGAGGVDTWAAGALRFLHGFSPAGWRWHVLEWDVWTLGWVLVLLPLCVVLADSSLGSTVVGLALFRYGDVVVDRARSLLDPAPAPLAPSSAGRRGLVLGGLHLAELALVVATVHRWQTGAAAGISLVVGFDTVTFRGPSLVPGNWIDTAVVLGTAGTLVVLTTVAFAVVSMAVSLVRERV